jgi:hypothetical protein
MRNPSLFSIQIMAAALALACGISGCRVHVDKGANGEDKSVQVDTPFGGMHVNTGQTTAADLGLPVYPGAQIVTDKDNDKSADVHMGFGEWELRVKAVNYATPDSQEKVQTFYKKALARYGAVISCQGDQAVGMPVSTPEGLTCQDDSKNSKVKVNTGNFNYSSDSGFSLKAGSKRHQHIVAFDSSEAGQTRFSLVALDLPAVLDGGTDKSD